MYCSAGNIEMLSLKDFFLLYLKKQKYWNYEYIKIIYVNCGVKNCVKEDLRSYISILCSWKPEKRDSNPWPLRQYCYSTKLIMKCPLCIKQNFMKSNSVCNSSTGLACTQMLFCFSFDPLSFAVLDVFSNGYYLFISWSVFVKREHVFQKVKFLWQIEG